MILLPAYNERDRIGPLVTAAAACPDCAEVVVADDGSSDGTCEAAASAGATVLPLPFNLGYGVALQTGYKYALARGYSYLVQMDSDGQHDPAGIGKILERVKQDRCDVCIGSRFLEGGTYRVPWSRRIGMILFRRVASALLGHTITDPTSGFQAMNRRTISFFCRDAYPVDYPDTNVLVMLHRSGFRVCEAPVVMHANPSAKSIHSGLKPLYYIFKMSLDIPLNLLRKER